MNIPTTKKKQWITPEIVDLNVQNTNSGVSTFNIESTVGTSVSNFCAPSS